METGQGFEDLQWLLQAINSDTTELHTVSFHLSQPASASYHQETTQSSITVHIAKESPSTFSEFLQSAAASRTNPSLKNLEFHTVKWDSHQIKNLCSLIANSPGITRLAFQQNEFAADSFAQFSEFLRKNECLKEINLSESGIGSQGARLLATALKENTALQELHVLDDSIGTNGAEELSTMIEANASLKLLNISDPKPIVSVPVISAVLARNRTINVHISSGKKTSSKVVEFLREESTLKLYGNNNLDVSSLCHVTHSLGLNSTIVRLDMSGLRLNSRWAKEFRSVIEQNRTLKEVVLSETCLKDKGVVYVSAGLFKNRSLEKLYLHGNRFGPVGVEHLLCPLSKFSSLQIQANTTLKTVTLGGKKTKIGRDGLISILQMLKSNQSLAYLGIYEDESLKPGDVVRIFESLQRNESLRCLSLKGCRGARGDRVLEAIMETISINPWIEEIDLTGTPLQLSGKTEGIHQKLSEREKTEEIEEVDYLKEMPLVTAKACRVFLCGQDYAGKRTLGNSIAHSFSNSKVPYIDQVRTLLNPIEQAVEKPGIKIRMFTDKETRISLWNLGTQMDSLPLQEIMFPGGAGSASLFLIVSSLFKKPSNRDPKTETEIEEDLHHWLRFIVSNSKRAVQQRMLPTVTIVLSHYDIIANNDSFQTTSSVIQRLKDKFQGFVRFHPTVFTVDARSQSSVSGLNHHIRTATRDVLERMPRVYQICNDLASILSEWRRENRWKPVMSWREYEELCQAKVPHLRICSRRVDRGKVETRRRGMAVNLHGIGELIYFEGSGILILDFEWFYGEVTSRLSKLEVKGRRSSAAENGFVRREELEQILRESSVFEGLVEAGDVVNVMLKLELCFEQDLPDSNSSPLFVPSLLEDGRWKPQKWSAQTRDCNYVGRRLQCDESSHTFLPPSFFSKMQVHLHNKVTGLKNHHGVSITLEKHLISISTNGISIRVEHGGQFGNFVDALASSPKPPTEMLTLLHNLVLPSLHSIIASTSETALTEHVIRSECVRTLTPPRLRKSQCVPLHHLKQAILSVPADGIHEYQHTWDPVMDSSGNVVLNPGFDFARDLLSDEDFREVLKNRYNDLYNLAVELQIPNGEGEGEDKSGLIDPSFKGIAKGVEAILEKLDVIRQEIRDVRQEIQGLRHYEHRLLVELSRKVNFLVNFSVELEERKVPNMFYLVAAGSRPRRLVTSLVPGMTALRLHLLCEFGQEMHVVGDQMGIELLQVDGVAVRCLAPYVKKFAKILTFALKIGAHLAAGMGGLIPDLGREVAHLTESPFLYGAAAAGLLAAAGAGRGGSNSAGSRDIGQDFATAQQWLLDFLRDRRCLSGKEIAEKFGLWRVRYRADGRIAWVCTMHLHARAREIVQLPI